MKKSIFNDRSRIFGSIQNIDFKREFVKYQSTITASTVNIDYSALNAKPSKAEPLKVTKKHVAYWYLFSAFLVFGIVVLGGVTRLTESGLSIVEWNLIRGMKPPSSEQEWEAEFEKYKAFPEYKLLNHNMNLQEFKRIFYMEWAHRMWGRAIGLAFIIPGVYFAARGFMTNAIKIRSLVIAGMIGTQGAFGWLMVKSGLDDEIVKRKDVPRVNHFWLSTHLGSAFLIYSAMLFTGLEILKQNRHSIQKVLTSAAAVKGHAGFRVLSAAVLCMIFVTAISGAWVAGLDAGLIYNEFPYMGDSLVPSDMWAYSTPPDSNTPAKMSWIENLGRNPAAVQFNHRVLAISTFTAISALWLISRRVPISATSRLASTALLGAALAQVSLGITTLLYFVPVPVAAAHQTGSLTLLSFGIWLLHTLRRIK